MNETGGDVVSGGRGQVDGVCGGGTQVLEVGAVSSGTVVRFNGTSGYGFITPDDGGADVFLHASMLPDDVKSSMRLGTRVEYQAVQSDRGPKVVSVTVLSTRQPSPAQTDDQDDQLCDVVSASAFAQKVTDVLIEVTPGVTGAQITEVRQRLLSFARRHGWIED
jgi:cold shock protein